MHSKLGHEKEPALNGREAAVHGEYAPALDQHAFQLIARIKRNHAEGFALPAGFDHASLAEIHRREPTWRLEMILHCRLADHVHAARAAGSILVSHEPQYCVMSDVQEMHDAGIAVLCTLLSVEHGRELLEMGVDFFEADDVRLSRDTLRQMGRR